MDSVETFIDTHFLTVEELEILLLLRRSPETFWSVDAIAQHLSLRTDLVGSMARALTARGLLRAGESGPNFRFAPASSAIAEEMGRVAEDLDRRRGLPRDHRRNRR